MLAGNEFQSLGRAIVKEDEYEELRWDGIVSIVSWRERVFRLWWEESLDLEFNSLAEKKLPTEGCTGRNDEREKSSGQKKISSMWEWKPGSSAISDHEFHLVANIYTTLVILNVMFYLTTLAICRGYISFAVVSEF
ncbi:hypothetical protein ANN_04170 [Periplaneta americana]|uniref:Uncharacterized protein n=1 Tax=Periplaneta americana TaxID=6978 RepID=A0ABQ8T9M5_PERAM|nr:hypothetical protein ANN_04170 [Periplaneta americana]